MPRRLRSSSKRSTYRVKNAGSGWNVWEGSRRWIFNVVSVLAIGVCLSCGKVPLTNYYTLRVPPPPQAHDPRTSAALGIERLSAPDALRDDRIVYYESPTQLNFYNYHRWSSEPATMMRDSIARRLRQEGVFSEIRMVPAREPVDYVLRGRLLNFEEVDFEGAVKGRVALELTLSRARDRRLIWSGTRQGESAAQGKGVSAVVEALNAASDQVLNGLLSALVARVEQDAQPGSQKSP